MKCLQILINNEYQIFLMNIEMNKIVTILYINWRGVESERRIIPQELYFTSNEWHKEEQWLLKAWDLDKEDYRNFAMKDIRKWQ